MSWEEVEAAVDAGDRRTLSFEAPEVLERVAGLGDLFAPAVDLRQELPPLV